RGRVLRELHGCIFGPGPAWKESFSNPPYPTPPAARPPVRRIDSPWGPSISQLWDPNANVCTHSPETCCPHPQYGSIVLLWVVDNWVFGLYTRLLVCCIL